MAVSKRVKKRVLRQAVEHNLDFIEGRYPSRRRHRSALTAVRSLALVGLPAMLFAAYLVAAISGVRDSEASAEPQVAVAIPSPGRSLPEAVFEPVRQSPRTVPKPLDPGVFPLPVHTIVLDPGHGGRNVGTLGPAGLQEKEITLDVGLRLEELLQESGFAVEMTRRTDRSVSLEERAQYANQRRADIFISIHVNWIDTRVRGVETYYLGPTDDPYLNQLAAQENRGSGYSMADFRRLLERVYVNVREDESMRLASEVQRALHGALRRISPDLQNRGVKRAPFAVLTGTEMPAILAEVSCLSNEEEARLLKLPEYRQYIAEAMAHGIRGYALQLTAGPQSRGS